MGLRDWWFGTVERGVQQDGTEVSCTFAGQTILLSHYQEIRADFEAVCSEVHLYRGGDEGMESYGLPPDPRWLAPDPADADAAAMKSLVLAGYVPEIQWPVITFEFGSAVPGRLQWQAVRVGTNPGMDLGYQMQRSAMAENLSSDDFAAKLRDRSEQLSAALLGAYTSSVRRVLESDQRRSVPIRSWSLLARSAVWVTGAALLLWLVLAAPLLPLPAVLIAAIALATAISTVAKAIRIRMLDGNTRRWQRGPTRLRVTSRQEVREARANTHRDLWFGAGGTLFGAVVGWLGTWLLGSG